MLSKNNLNNTLESLTQMLTLDTEMIDGILNKERMNKRERRSWLFLRNIAIHLEITIKIETLLVEEMLLSDAWMNDFGTDLIKAASKIPELERDLKRLKKKKQQLELLVSEKYKKALDLITRQIEESARAQRHYVT